MHMNFSKCFLSHTQILFLYLNSLLGASEKTHLSKTRACKLQELSCLQGKKQLSDFFAYDLGNLLSACAIGASGDQLPPKMMSQPTVWE